MMGTFMNAIGQVIAAWYPDSSPAAFTFQTAPKIPKMVIRAEDHPHVYVYRLVTYWDMRTTSFFREYPPETLFMRGDQYIQDKATLLRNKLNPDETNLSDIGCEVIEEVIYDG